MLLAPPLTDPNTILFPLGIALGLSVVIERMLEFFKNISGVARNPTREREFPDLTNALALTEALTRLADLDAHRQEEEHRGDELKLELEAIQSRMAGVANELRQLTRRSESEDVSRDVHAKRTEMVDLEIALDEAKAALAKLQPDGAWEESFPPSTILVESATAPNEAATLRAFVLLVVASAFGIVAARLGHVGIFGPLFQALGHGAGITPVGDYILTGLFIGGGSGPAHLLIRFISERTVPVPKDEVKDSSIPKPMTLDGARNDGEVEAMATSLATSAITPAPSLFSALPVGVTTLTAAPPTTTVTAWRDVAYDGGVDRAILEAVHRRSDDPNLIVFHHTAMHSRSTFQDVVRVIKGRKTKSGQHWLTGYHCVVLFDGSIHPFCRWDRFGNHAEGRNDRSLGITLNGNFETDASVPYSNPNGRFGATRPSAAQLDSAARVIALWCHLYGIPAEFDKAVIPHKWIATTKKTCPGSNFPYDEFRRLVAFYHDAWHNSDDAKAHVASFARKPYLFSGSRLQAWV